MKSILISIKPKWCVKIMNGEKTIEVRTNKALYKATQKLIDEYGFAEFYVYCTKDNKQGLVWDNRGKGLVNSSLFPYGKDCPETYRLVNGKVVFKFRCYNVEEIKERIGVFWVLGGRVRYTDNVNEENLLKRSCLLATELDEYFKGKNGYAIHISDLEIFDRPKELCEFESLNENENKCRKCPYYVVEDNESYSDRFCMFDCCRITKAPQNFCYVEVE